MNILILLHTFYDAWFATLSIGKKNNRGIFNANVENVSTLLKEMRLVG